MLSSSFMIPLPRYPCFHLRIARAIVAIPFPVFPSRRNFVYAAQFRLWSRFRLRLAISQFPLRFSLLFPHRDRSIIVSAFNLRSASSVLRPASPQPDLCLAVLRLRITISWVCNRIYLSSPPRNHIAIVFRFGLRVAPAASRPSRFSPPCDRSHFPFHSSCTSSTFFVLCPQPFRNFYARRNCTFIQPPLHFLQGILREIIRLGE